MNSFNAWLVLILQKTTRSAEFTLHFLFDYLMIKLQLLQIALEADIVYRLALCSLPLY